MVIEMDEGTNGAISGESRTFTLLAVSPFLAMRSAPTTAMSVDVLYLRSEDEWGRTDGVDGLVLEKRADHCIANHGGGDGKRVEL